MRVLVVEQNRALASALKLVLQREYPVVDLAHHGVDGLGHGLMGRYDLIVLDFDLPGLTGFQLARRLRKASIDSPILVLIPQDIPDKARQVLGVNDVLVKPFDANTLLARARVLTSPPEPEPAGEDIIRLSSLCLNCTQLILSSGQREVKLDFEEFEVMRLLMLSQGSALSQAEMVAKLGGSNPIEAEARVDVYIAQLREKLAYLECDVDIGILRKAGYHLQPHS